MGEYDSVVGLGSRASTFAWGILSEDTSCEECGDACVWVIKSVGLLWAKQQDERVLQEPRK